LNWIGKGQQNFDVQKFILKSIPVFFKYRKLQKGPSIILIKADGNLKKKSENLEGHFLATEV